MTAVPSATKIVLVTGANQGIGLAITKKLLTEHKGYHVLMGSRNPERGHEAASELQKQSLSAEAITIDVTDDASITAAAKTVSTKYGRLDVLINNAGISVERAREGEPLRPIFQDIYAVNVFGAAIVTETFIPLLKKSSSPRIVFMTSTLGSLSDKANPESIYAQVQVPIYRSSKAALNMLVLHYATLYKGEGWKVNVTCPGFVKSNLNNFNGRDSTEDGAVNAVRLATLGEDGETGTFSDKNGPVGW